jgi:DNA replication protein DnaC
MYAIGTDRQFHRRQIRERSGVQRTFREPIGRDDLALARGDGRYARIQRSLGGVQLLILDDWGLEPLDAAARHDLLEILEERYGRRSTIITSQIPVDKWHEMLQIREEVGFTKGRIIVRGKLVTRGQAKRADYTSSITSRTSRSP